jgi:glycerophosphodiester phosphodiesterase
MRPILDASFSVIGNLSFQYLVVTPFHHEKNIFYDDVLGSNWGSSIDMIGHRGMGVNRTSYIRENTLLSFKTAHLQGIKYVEFDVHLTTDNVPVIYHDFFISLKDVLVSIANLSLKQFRQALSIHTSDLPESPKMNRFIRSKSAIDIKQSPLDKNHRWLLSDPKFPTLKELFEHVPIDVGFNVEIKYPDNAVLAKSNYLERNSYINYILEVIFSHANNRSLYFSSFDPDICILLSRKQRKYPVFFLTEGKETGHRHYDSRCNSVLDSAQFAQHLGLTGLVTDSKPILNNLNYIKEIHNKNLLLFTYGSLNNLPDSVYIQKQNGVDAIISDKISKIR